MKEPYCTSNGLLSPSVSRKVARSASVASGRIMATGSPERWSSRKVMSEMPKHTTRSRSSRRNTYRSHYFLSLASYIQIHSSPRAAYSTRLCDPQHVMLMEQEDAGRFFLQEVLDLGVGRQPFLLVDS